MGSGKIQMPIYVKLKVKLPTLGERDPRAPVSIATTLRCRGGCYFFPWIAPLYPWSLPYIAVLSKEASSTIFWVFGMTRPGIEPRSPGPLANTLTIMPMSGKSKNGDLRRRWPEGSHFNSYYTKM